MLNSSDVREVVERALRDALAEAEWNYLEEHGYARDVQNGEPGALNDAVGAVRKGRQAFRRDAPSPSLTPERASSARPKRARPLDWHERAVSDILAAHAEQEAENSGVRHWRLSVLGGKLLKLEEIEQWVKDQAAKQGPATIWRSRGAGRRLELLSYGVAGSGWAFHQPTRNGSPLDRLRVISQKLAKYYGWDEAQATLFVLTGMVPLLHTIRSTVTTSSPLLIRSRIRMVIDPTCTPAEVADYYRRIRRETFNRIRRLSEKHARLAAFVAREPDGVDKHESMKRWNSECISSGKRAWRYRDANQFRRDGQQALDRIVELGQIRSHRDGAGRKKRAVVLHA